MPKYVLDATFTQCHERIGGHNTAHDHLMIRISTIGVPILVLAVATMVAQA
ncbi:hypothetical protein [Pararhizobium qamdonense]|uniref:hypothetical protein n=1 Tax=Pararhizobium qamdonense TaxID=3031126 RepID=UPI0023E22C75|nr:hypothetical protein [Pararhizobium qamdonense]